MAAYLFDSSAVAKRYMQEVGSAWIRTLTDPATGHQCWLAEITQVEILAAFYKKARTGNLTQAQAQQAEAAFRNELPTHFQVIPLTSVLFPEAMRLVSTHPLRAYDAIQLAVALQLQAQRAHFGGLPALTFVSADQNLNQCAAVESLTVDDPNQHP